MRRRRLGFMSGLMMSHKIGVLKKHTKNGEIRGVGKRGVLEGSAEGGENKQLAICVDTRSLAVCFRWIDLLL